MPTVRLEPRSDIPMPYDMSPEEPPTFEEELTSAAATAEVLAELGAPIEVSNTDFAEEQKLLEAAVKDKKVKNLASLPVALGASAFLRAYGTTLAHDMVQVRMALTNKLLEIADCGDIKYELKAIELLGKHSDVGLFTERSEINVNYNSAEGLEAAIKERVKRLLNADVVDIKPLGVDLEEELGIVEGDYDELDEPDAPEDLAPEDAAEESAEVEE